MSTTIPPTARTRPNLELTRELATARALGRPSWLIAQEVGISPALLSLISHGRARATHENAIAIAAALGRPLQALFPEQD